MITAATVEEIETLLKAGEPKRHVAKRLQVSLGVVYAVAHGSHYRQKPGGRVRFKRLTDADVRQVESVLGQDLTPRQIARALGISRNSVRRIAAGAHRSQAAPLQDSTGYLPSPARIAAECERIRSRKREARPVSVVSTELVA